MAVLDLFTAIAPELVDAPNRDVHIEIAEAQTGEVFGTQRGLAVALLAAHALTLANRGATTGGASGAVSSLKEGQLAVVFSTTSTNSGGLGATSYGVELLRLRRQYILGARTGRV